MGQKKNKKGGKKAVVTAVTEVTEVTEVTADTLRETFLYFTQDAIFTYLFENGITTFDGEKSDQELYDSLCDVLFQSILSSDNPTLAQNTVYNELKVIDSSIFEGQLETENLNDNKLKLVQSRYELNLIAEKKDAKKKFTPKNCHCGSVLFTHSCRSLHVQAFETFKNEEDKQLDYFRSKSANLSDIFEIQKTSTEFRPGQVRGLKPKGLEPGKKPNPNESEKTTNRKNEENIKIMFKGDNISRFYIDGNMNLASVPPVPTVPALLVPTVPASPVPADLVPAPSVPAVLVPAPPACDACRLLPDNRFTKCKHLNPVTKITCPECPKTFANAWNLKLHKRFVHNGEKPFPCPECSQRFQTKIAAKKHFESVHKKIKHFKCNFCSKMLSTKSSRDVHILSVHEKKKPFECSSVQCKAEFGTKSAMTRHFKLVHEKKKPFSCPCCQVFFSIKAQLTRHNTTLKHIQNSKM